MKRFLRQMAPIAVILAVFYGVQWYRSAPLVAEGETVNHDQTIAKLETGGFVVPVTGLFDVNDNPKLVYFFAPWCSICRISMPAVDELANERNDVDIIAVALSYDSIEQVQQFTQQLGLSLPVYLGDHTTMSDYRVAVFPTFYILDANLTVVDRGIGVSTKIGLSWRLDSVVSSS